MNRQHLREAYARQAWVIAGAILFAVIAYISWQFIGTLILGLFLYYASRPLYRRVKRALRNSTISAVIAMAMVALPSVGTAIYAASIAYNEAYRAVNLHDTDTLRPFLEPVIDFIPVESVEVVMEGIRSPYEVIVTGFTPTDVPILIDTALQSVAVLGNVVFHIFVALILSFYMLRDGHRLRSLIMDSCQLHGGVAEEYLYAVDQNFNKVFFGNIMNAFVTAIFAALTFYGFNYLEPAGLVIPYPMLLAILSGIASLIPFVGIKPVYFPLTGYFVATLWFTDAWSSIWAPLVFFAFTWIVVDAIPDMVLRPYFSGGGIHMGAIMLSYIFGPIFFGWYGLFLGPMILVCGIQFLQIVVPTLIGPKNTRLYDY